MHEGPVKGSELFDEPSALHKPKSHITIDVPFEFPAIDKR